MESGNILKSFNQPNDSNNIFKYCTDHSVKLTDVQQQLLKYTLEHVPRSLMIGAPETIQLNMNLMRLIRAKKVLDVGVFTGFSSLGAALAISEEGKVVALDVNEEFTNIGKRFWQQAKVDHKIELIIQPALDSLNDLIAKGESGSFDFAFIDADKKNYKNYYDKCMTLVRPGGIISIDNVLWSGRVMTPDDTSPDTVALREINDFIMKDTRVNSNMLPVGDGLTLCFKL